MRINIPKNCKYIVGVDEAGRGPLAGPVTVGVVVVSVKNKIPKNINKKIKLQDSKKMSAVHRDVWFEHIRNNKKFIFSSSSVSATTIDRIGITKSIHLAIKRSINKLEKKKKINQKNSFVLLDGLLKAPEKYKQKTITKGDQKIPIISAASVVAKVIRDKKMLCYHKKFPQYSFDKHKGYGTKRHYGAICKNGLCNFHRRSFLKKVTK